MSTVGVETILNVISFNEEKNDNHQREISLPSIPFIFYIIYPNTSSRTSSAPPKAPLLDSTIDDGEGNSLPAVIDVLLRKEERAVLGDEVAEHADKHSTVTICMRHIK